MHYQRRRIKRVQAAPPSLHRKEARVETRMVTQLSNYSIVRYERMFNRLNNRLLKVRSRMLPKSISISSRPMNNCPEPLCVRPHGAPTRYFSALSQILHDSWPSS